MSRKANAGIVRLRLRMTSSIVWVEFKQKARAQTSAEARSEQDVLFDGALFENRLGRIGFLVADGHFLVQHRADEVAGFLGAHELMNILSGAVLADEVGVFQGDEPALDLGKLFECSGVDSAIHRGPA